MNYERQYYGPGSIGNMPSGYGLTRPPTISSNDRPRNIQSLQGCSGCGVGDNGVSAAGIGAGAVLLPVAIGAAAYYLFFHNR